MTALILDSLQRRMAAMHSLYYQAVSTMGPEHVNHFEREKVLPIALFALPLHKPRRRELHVHHWTDADLER